LRETAYCVVAAARGAADGGLREDSGVSFGAGFRSLAFFFVVCSSFD